VGKNIYHWKFLFFLQLLHEPRCWLQYIPDPQGAALEKNDSLFIFANFEGSVLYQQNAHWNRSGTYSSVHEESTKDEGDEQTSTESSVSGTRCIIA